MKITRGYEKTKQKNNIFDPDLTYLLCKKKRDKAVTNKGMVVSLHTNTKYLSFLIYAVKNLLYDMFYFHAFISFFSECYGTLTCFIVLSLSIITNIVIIIISLLVSHYSS